MVEALNLIGETVENMREEYRMRRDFVPRAFNEMELPCLLPRGAFNTFPSVRETGLNSRKFLRFAHELAGSLRARGRFRSLRGRLLALPLRYRILAVGRGGQANETERRKTPKLMAFIDDEVSE